MSTERQILGIARSLCSSPTMQRWDLNSDMSWPHILPEPKLFMEKGMENVLNWPHF